MVTTAPVRRTDPFRFAEWFELPELFKPFDREMIRVEETVKKDHVVIKAEMPGIDPAKDVEIHISEGLLTISAERHEEERTEDGGTTVSEFRYGSFRRTLRVPKHCTATDVKASYKDGILTITVPIPKDTKPETVKVAVSRS